MFPYTIITCLLLTAVNVRAQCNRPFVGENRVLAVDTDEQTFPEGSTLQFKCSTGYTPANGNRTITCTGTDWSELELQCKKRSCGHPGNIKNGEFKYPRDGILFGATINATCHDGYKLVGPKSRNCRENGWDGRNPECEVVKCPPPPSIENGKFERMDEVYDYRDTVVYSCDWDLHLVGNEQLYCSVNGTFEPAPPRCTALICDKPNIPNAIKIEGKSPPYKYLNYLRYQCRKGFKMEGDDFLVCKENGWDPPPPQCTVITCKDPPAITNGLFQPLQESYGVGESVTYYCKKGYKLQGLSKISCTDNGMFETSLPQCQEIFCEFPHIPDTVIAPQLKTYSYNTSIKITCTGGYSLQGPDTVTCGDNEWTPALPHCKPKTCDAPRIANAVIVEKAPYTYKMSITVKCIKGYRIEGTGTVTCTENGWDVSPKCNTVTCLPPPAINNGWFTPVKTIYTYGQSVKYSCKDNLQLSGAETILCTEHETFQDPPQCTEIPGDYGIVFAVLGITVLLVCIAGVIAVYFKKRKSKKSKPESKHENHSLVLSVEK